MARRKSRRDRNEDYNARFREQYMSDDPNSYTVDESFYLDEDQTQDAAPDSNGYYEDPNDPNAVYGSDPYQDPYGGEEDPYAGQGYGDAYRDTGYQSGGYYDADGNYQEGYPDDAYQSYETDPNGSYYASAGGNGGGRRPKKSGGNRRLMTVLICIIVALLLALAAVLITTAHRNREGTDVDGSSMISDDFGSDGEYTLSPNMTTQYTGTHAASTSRAAANTVAVRSTTKHSFFNDLKKSTAKRTAKHTTARRRAAVTTRRKTATTRRKTSSPRRSTTAARRRTTAQASRVRRTTAQASRRRTTTHRSNAVNGEVAEHNAGGAARS